MTKTGFSRAAHLRLGRRGESLACRLLEESGCTILARNWRCAAGELDIVARDGTTLVFAEVKSRRMRPDRRPGENLSRRQFRRDLRAAGFLPLGGGVGPGAAGGALYLDAAGREMVMLSIQEDGSGMMLRSRLGR